MNETNQLKEKNCKLKTTIIKMTNQISSQEKFMNTNKRKKKRLEKISKKNKNIQTEIVSKQKMVKNLKKEVSTINKNIDHRNRLDVNYKEELTQSYLFYIFCYMNCFNLDLDYLQDFYAHLDDTGSKEELLCSYFDLAKVENKKGFVSFMLKIKFRVLINFLNIF